MTAPPARAPSGGLVRVVVGVIAFSLVAPIGLVALPLATLTAASHPRAGRSLLIGIAAAVAAAWWLVVPGELPGQTVRAAAVIATAAFAVSTVMTQWSAVHRGLLAAAVAAGGLGTGFLAFGWSWDRLHWWVAYRTAATLRLQLGLLWRGARENVLLSPSAALLRQMESAYGSIITGMADLFPATVVLELLAGFVLAVAIHHRIARHPVGTPLGWFSQFRFSEHLGWATALPLAALLIVKISWIRLLGVNLLVVMATLYVIRGLAVAAFGLRLLRPGLLLYAVLTVALFFMLPVALGSALVLGVLDAGLDLRGRWAAQPSDQ